MSKSGLNCAVKCNVIDSHTRERSKILISPLLFAWGQHCLSVFLATQPVDEGRRMVENIATSVSKECFVDSCYVNRCTLAVKYSMVRNEIGGRGAGFLSLLKTWLPLSRPAPSRGRSKKETIVVV